MLSFLNALFLSCFRVNKVAAETTFGIYGLTETEGSIWLETICFHLSSGEAEAHTHIF